MHLLNVFLISLPLNLAFFEEVSIHIELLKDKVCPLWTVTWTVTFCDVQRSFLDKKKQLCACVCVCVLHLSVCICSVQKPLHQILS